MSIDINEIEREQARAKKNAVVMRWGILLILIAIIAALVALSIRDHYRGKAIEDLGSALNQQRQQVADCAKPKAERPIGLDCKNPVVPNAQEIIKDIERQGPVDVTKVGPPGPPGPIGATGPAGPPPSPAAVQAAVNLYCSTGRCDGQSPSSAEVSAAVAAYCDARGECRGPRGDAGKNGANGVDGKDGVNGLNGADGAPGPQGPPPSDAQVLAAVQNYCSGQPGGSCEGPKGDIGPQGPSGVVRVNDQCQPEDGEVVSDVGVTYDDATKTITVTCATAPAFPGVG